MRRRLAWLASASALAVGLWTGVASEVGGTTCLCPVPNQAGHDSVPFGELSGPENTLVWLPIFDTEEVEIRRPDDSLVNVLERGVIEWPRQGFESGQYRVLQPVSDLPPAIYGVTVRDSTFALEIRPGIDDEPPPIPEVVAREVVNRRDGIGCRSEAHYIELELDVEPGLVVAAFDGEEDELDADDRTGRVIGVSTNGRFQVGATCGSMSNWPDADAGAVADIRLAAFDPAGNFSGWSEPITIELGRGCGCQANGGRSTGLLGAVGFLLLLSRRRRRGTGGPYRQRRRSTGSNNSASAVG